MKNQKGITLIPLVITIIVMLILVAVTITIAVNGGLFNYASEAGRKTNSAMENEQILGSGMAKVSGTDYEDEFTDINAIVDFYTTNNDVTDEKIRAIFNQNDFVGFEVIEVEPGTEWATYVESLEDYYEDLITLVDVGEGSDRIVAYDNDPDSWFYKQGDSNKAKIEESDTVTVGVYVITQ